MWQNLSSAAVGISFGDYLNMDCEIYNDKLFSTSKNENTFTMCSHNLTHNFVRSQLFRIHTVFHSACNTMLIKGILQVILIKGIGEESSMGLVVRKPAFGVSNKVRFKPACSATETSKKSEISPLASLHMILSKKRTTKALIRLRVCAGWSATMLFTNP